MFPKSSPINRVTSNTGVALLNNIMTKDGLVGGELENKPKKGRCHMDRLIDKLSLGYNYYQAQIWLKDLLEMTHL